MKLPSSAERWKLPGLSGEKGAGGGDATEEGERIASAVAAEKGTGVTAADTGEKALPRPELRTGDENAEVELLMRGTGLLCAGATTAVSYGAVVMVSR